MIYQIKTNLQKKKYWEESELTVQQGFQENEAVCLYPQYTDQTFLGFGGAFTEAAAYTWKNLSAENRAALIGMYFGKDGLRYALGRTHMGSCDFALGNYACLEGPGKAPTAGTDDGPGEAVAAGFAEDSADASSAGADDVPGHSGPAGTAHERFHMERDREYLIPMIKAADEAAGAKIRMLLSPWSPPAFMKSNGEMNHGGKLLTEYRALWADCIARYVSEYRRAGIDVSWVSVQNEPNAVQTWDSCVYSAEEEGAFAADWLRPALDRAGAEDVGILIWDHNKDLLLDRMERSLSQPGCANAVCGVAFHWYSGDHFEAVEIAHRIWPEKTLFFTEGCVEYSRYAGMSDLRKAEMYAHDIIGNLNAGTSASIDWNLLLDADGGPNHVGNFCEAPVMATQDGGLERKGSYYYIGQISRYVRPGAVRFGLSRYSAGIEATAFKNTDGSLAAVLLNRGDVPREAKLRLSLSLSLESYIPVTLDAHEIVTVVITA